MNDILKYAIEHGIIDISYVQEKIEMNKREELLKKHIYSIWQGKNDGKWYTYLPDEEKGRVLKRRSKKKDLEDDIVDYWRTIEENPTIREVFDEWNDRKLQLKKICSSTYLRNQQFFNKHYTEFGKRRIKNVDAEEYEEFLEEQIPKYNLSSKAFSGLKTITRGLLKRAKKRGFIDFNVEEIFQELDVSDKDFKKVIKQDCEEVFDEEEMPMVLKYLEENLDIRNLGILILFLTGIRIGELVTLKYSDFSGTSFKVMRTETKIPVDYGYSYEVKDYPKTPAGVRTAIIPNEYSWVAEKIKSRNMLGEFVFVENGKRLTTNHIRRRMSSICKKLRIVHKSPHKARKTYGTILMDNHIDNRLIIDVMGHTNIICTENHYHRNRRSIERKAEIISHIPEFRQMITYNQK